jgi:glycosyltransferase involved in cell wall biosynthesis
MAIQANMLVKALGSEGLDVVLIKTNLDLPRSLQFFCGVDYVRPVVKLWVFIWRLLKSVRRVDVVHLFSASHLFFFAFAVPTILISRFYGKRMILNYRGGEAEAFLGGWGAIVKLFTRMCDVVVVPSGFLREVFAKHNIQTVVVPNIVDRDRFEYKERQCLAPKLLITRHLEKAYNIECILRAFVIVKERYPDAELGIVGAGDEPEEAQRLKDLVRDWALRGVTFHGYVAHERLHEIYQQYDIYVNASYIDNFPGALIEAFACGLPVVSTRAGGIPYIIQDGQTGFLVPLNDHLALADRVLELLANPPSASRMAKAARAKCEEYHWASVYKSLLALYRHRIDAAGDLADAHP